MGICPCTRDVKPPSSLSANTTQPSADSLSSSTERLISARTFRGEGAAIEHRTEPLAAAFSLESEEMTEGQIRVIKAVATDTRRRSRIKTFQKQRMPFAADTKAQFLQMLQRLDHPNILKTLEVSQDDDNLYVITEDYDGGDLEAYLGAKTILPHALAASVIRQVLGALAYCHGLNVIHGALTLKTVLLTDTPDEEKIAVKLTGFAGCDYQLIGESTPVTWFSAPEIENGELTDRSDIWSCGVMLYILLCGHNPFDSSRTSAVSSKLKLKGISFPPVSWGKTSHDILTLVASMMSVDPPSRPSANQCLAHPWIMQKAKRISLTGKRSTTPRSKASLGALKNALMHFLVTRIMKGTDTARLAEMLISLDTNNDGTLVREELLASVQQLSPADEEVREIVTKVQRSANRTIEIPEVLLPVIQEKNLLHRDSLKLAYNSMGQDSDGKVSIAGLQALLRISNGSWSADQWKELVSDVEGVEPERVDFTGFRGVVMKIFRS